MRRATPRNLASAVGFDAFQLAADHSGTALDLEDAGQYPVRVQASVHACGHRLPDRVEPSRELLFRTRCQLVAARDVGDRHAMLIAERKQRRRVGITERDGTGTDLRILALAPDEPATDGEVGLLGERCTVCTVRDDRHGIRMPWQPGARGELDVILGERDLVRTVDEQRLPSRKSVHAERTSAGLQASGASPRRPATTASGVPCPMPVAPSEP